MGFWDLFIKNKIPHKSPESIIAELTIGDNQYLLKEFDILFRQKINNINQPEGDVYFENMRMVMNSQPDNQLFDSVASGKVWSYGEINFYSCNEKITKGSLLKISFQESRCINLDRNTSDNKENCTTKLSIVPYSITIGNETIVRQTDIK